MRRFFRPAALLVALLVLAAAGYAGFWFYAAGRVCNGLADWSEARRAEGYKVDYVAPAISGFPFGIKIVVDHPAVAAPGGRWSWSGDGIEAESHPWTFHRIVLRPIGQQVLEFPSDQGPAQKVSASAAATQIVATLNNAGKLQRAIADVEGLALVIPGAVGPVSAQNAHLDLSLAAAESPTAPAAATANGNPPATLPPSVLLSLSLENLVLPKAIAGPLGPQLHWLAIDGEITGKLPPDKPTAALAAWRDEGGTIELKNLGFDWGPLQLAADATVALDHEMQPEGAGTAKIRGYAETIDALVAQGLIKPENGMVAKAGLGLLAKPADDGARVLTVPLTLERQVLYAGPMMILTLPTIKWPG